MKTCLKFINETWHEKIRKRQLIDLNPIFSWLCFASVPFKRNYTNDLHVLNAHLEILSVIHVTQIPVKCWRIGPRVGRVWWQRDKITELSSVLPSLSHHVSHGHAADLFAS